jgi:hypothetical protein
MSDDKVERQIAGFLGRYTPEIEAQLRACRGKLRARFPRGYELVYDNYNALVFGFGPSDRSSEAFLSIAGYPRWVTLFFLDGARLDDPDHLLEGTGSRVRGLRLRGADDLDSAPVQTLIRQAASTRREAFAAAPPMTTIIKSISAKQRPRRPPVSEPARARTPARPAAKRRKRGA